jgi:hypothetical protein
MTNRSILKNLLVAVAAAAAVVLNLQLVFSESQKTQDLSGDSQTTPQSNWVQVSGEIEATAIVKRQNDQDHVLTLLRPSEGNSRIAVDLGSVSTVGPLNLKNHDHIQVRGEPMQSGEQMIIIAKEVIADGKVTRLEGSGPQ